MSPQRRTPLARVVPPACAIAVALLAGGSAQAAPTMLADSTVEAHWTLANGLRVVTRHVPDATAVAITVAYGGGSRDDPQGREGLASLLAEVAYTSAAGEVPERRRTEMRGLRPAGWGLSVSPGQVRFTEAATIAQFPGVLHQVAARARGVTVSAASLEAALASVRSALAERFHGPPDRTLTACLVELAGGRGTGEIDRMASGEGLAGLTVAEVQKLVDERFVPANGILAVAGDLSGFDPRKLIENEFGSIPAGAAAAPHSRTPLKPGSYSLTLPGVSSPLGGVGVIGPALSDSLHPLFFLHLLQLGSFAREFWQRIRPQLVKSYDYSLLDDPRLVIFYPPLSSSPGKQPVAAQLDGVLAVMDHLPLDPDSRQEMFATVEWILGGAMAPDVLHRVKTDPAALSAYSIAMAAREAHGGEAFWAAYRRRFLSTPEPQEPRWTSRFASPQREVELQLLPAATPSR